jgi:hypothetical protein
VTPAQTRGAASKNENSFGIRINASKGTDGHIEK